MSGLPPPTANGPPPRLMVTTSLDAPAEPLTAMAVAVAMVAAPQLALLTWMALPKRWMTALSPGGMLTVAVPELKEQETDAWASGAAAPNASAAAARATRAVREREHVMTRLYGRGRRAKPRQRGVYRLFEANSGNTVCYVGPVAHAHSHGAAHHHDRAGTRRVLRLSLALTVVFGLAEAGAGFAFHSLALLADAVHNVSDGAAI